MDKNSLKIIHIGDLHIGKSLDGFSRIEEQKQFFEFFIDELKKISPDILLIAGDVFDTVNPSAEAESIFYENLEKMASVFNGLIVIISGNHDSSKRLKSNSYLAKKHGIIIYEKDDDVIQKGFYKNVQVLDCNKGVIKVLVNEKIVNIMAIPYLKESDLNESIIDLKLDDKENAVSFQKKFESLVEEKKKYFKVDEFNLIVAHLFTLKQNIKNEETGYSLGGAYIMDSKVFENTADYIALGHIHKFMSVSKGEERAFYSGSIIHYNKTEAKNKEKSFNFVKINSNKELELEKISIPIFKKIDIWDVNSIEEAIELSKEKSKENSYVYINVKTNRIILNSEIEKIKKNKSDIVQINPIFTEEINNDYDNVNMMEKSDEEKFINFYKEKYNSEPNENILKRFNEIMNFEI